MEAFSIKTFIHKFNKVPLIDGFFYGLITFNSNHACPPKSSVVTYHLIRIFDC